MKNQEQFALKSILQQLADSEQRFYNYINNNVEAMIVVSQHGIICHVNTRANQCYGKNAAVTLSRKLDLNQLIKKENTSQNRLQDDTLVNIQTISWHGQPSSLLSLRDISASTAEFNLEDHSGELSSSTEKISDDSKQLFEHKETVQSAKSQLNSLINSAGEGVLGIDLVGKINFANPKACKILGLENNHIIGRRMQSFFVLDNSDTDNLEQVIKQHEATPKDLLKDWNRQQVAQLLDQNDKNSDQHRYWETELGDKIFVEFSCKPTLDEAGNRLGAVVMFQDISERKQIEEKLINLANFDALTGLANRSHFHSTLEHAIERQNRSSKTLALLYLDMDHFKYINDSLGHGAGDELLVLAANQLRENVRAGDMVARLGGDEFAMVLYDINNAYDASNVAAKILSALTEPLNLASAEVTISFSIGIAVLGVDLVSLDDLIKAADTAMYAAKSEGRNNYKHYSASMQKASEDKQRLQKLLQRAILDKELKLVYQPKVSLSSKKMIGCEALLRWKPQDQDAIGPAIFIPNAEESGQINEIGEWVLQNACNQLSEWLKHPGFSGLSIAINVSARQLGKNTFFPLLKRLLNKHNIPSHALQIEITETGVMENIEIVIEELNSIHELGVKIALDDFGTGNASLELLRKLPLDILKIDRSFVQDIGKDKQDEEIIHIILAVAKTMGLEVVAEGVETFSQMHFLSMANCEVIQGYYFIEPISAQHFTKLLYQPAGAFLGQFAHYEKSMRTLPEDTVTEDTGMVKQGIDTLRVLVCEDDLDQAYLLQVLLEDTSFVIDIAVSASEAISMLSGKHYHAMTLDLEFGYTNGLDFLEQVRDNYPADELPVIVVSAHLNNKKYRDDCRRLGVSGWLTKPIDDVKLLEYFRQAITESSLVGLPRILHVEDTELQRLLVQDSLENVAQITPAVDLAEAKEALIYGQYDLVLLDLVLPDGDGTELLPSIEQLDNPPQVYILSGQKQDIALADRVDGQLDKSLDTFEQLNEIIMSALQKRLNKLTGQPV